MSANTPGYAVCVASQICERIGVHGYNRKSTNTSGWHCSNMWTYRSAQDLWLAIVHRSEACVYIQRELKFSITVWLLSCSCNNLSCDSMIVESLRLYASMCGFECRVTEYTPRFMSGSCKMLTHLVFSSIQFTARLRAKISKNLETGPWRQNPEDRMCHFSDTFLLQNSLNPKSPLDGAV